MVFMSTSSSSLWGPYRAPPYRAPPVEPPRVSTQSTGGLPWEGGFWLAGTAGAGFGFGFRLA